MSKGEEIIKTAKVIAFELGVSERTIRRMHQAGQLPTFQTAGNTSPLKITRKAIDAIKHRHGFLAIEGKNAASS